MKVDNPPTTIDEYIAGFPAEVQPVLEQMRQVIRSAAPEAEEKISYGCATFTLHGNLVHFAGYGKHLGFYPAPSAITAFAEELSVYKGAKGSVQFPLDQPLPTDLIRRMVEFRVGENSRKKAGSGKRKSG